MTSPDLSIIIPAYNEEVLIASTLDGLQAYLATRPEQYEIIVVDDGSQDKTVEAVKRWQECNGVDLRLLVNPQNRGKGFSIRRGMLESRGQFVIFIDADLPYKLEAIDVFLQALQNGSDLAIGSRVLPGSQVKGVPIIRFFSGQIFSLMVQTVLFPGLPDTQCGFKSFRAAAAREIFRRLTIDGFGFDVEMLYVARKHKLAIRPVAVQMIDHRHRSRVRLIADSFKMFANLFMVRWNDLRGKYK
ncbi:MAG TPA: dolichyl-phosphate beta-glucosyltransferase [Anaerolineales bacterium]|nr:dolichyl-phosphate beta-glucosyltransferase [Anaerolineales bacterium]